jgi:hypothetical protein
MERRGRRRRRCPLRVSVGSVAPGRATGKHLGLDRAGSSTSSTRRTGRPRNAGGAVISDWLHPGAWATWGIALRLGMAEDRPTTCCNGGRRATATMVLGSAPRPSLPRRPDRWRRRVLAHCDAARPEDPGAVPPECLCGLRPVDWAAARDHDLLPGHLRISRGRYTVDDLDTKHDFIPHAP